MGGRDGGGLMSPPQPTSKPPFPPPRSPTTAAAKATTAVAMEIMRRLGRMKSTVEPAGVLGVFFLSAACFLCCFLYLNYSLLSTNRGVVVGNALLGFGKHRQWQRTQEGLGLGLLSGWGEEMGTCDMFEGKWVWDEGYPLYDSRDCRFLDDGFRCSENGRPDSFYTKWRWQPAHCDLPKFDAITMLERLRNRRLVFVGDSIGRNQWESLLCMLSSSVSNKSSIYEVNGSPITKHNGFLVFKFSDFNCTVEYYRSPFLVQQGRAPAGAPKEVKTTLKLDIMDWTSARWRDADVLVFNTGHWWNHGKTIRSGCYFQVGLEVKMNMSADSAYRRSIETLFHWIDREVNMSKTQVIYRTYAPIHFRGGDWRTGGSCHLETLPELELASRPWALMLDTVGVVVSEHSTKGPALALDVLNITQMTAQRRDGHSSLYYLGPMSPAPLHRQDCSHWCLPGVPDAWNELLYALFLRWDLTRHRDTTLGHGNVKLG